LDKKKTTYLLNNI